MEWYNDLTNNKKSNSFDDNFKYYQRESFILRNLIIFFFCKNYFQNIYRVRCTNKLCLCVVPPAI